MRIPEGWTREEIVAWNGLQRRFPGISADIERTAMKMAVQMGHAGRTRIHFEERTGGFVGFIEAFSLLLNRGMSLVSYPVIPDEHNPRDDKQITPNMEPYVFARLSDCRVAAEEADKVLLRLLRAAEDEMFSKKRGEKLNDES